VRKSFKTVPNVQAHQYSSVEEQQDFRCLYTDPPASYSDKYPHVPKPEPELSPALLAAQWKCHDLYGEDMPLLAADLLEFGLDTPSLRRLAGEVHVACSYDVEELVGRVFRELSVPYPISDANARAIFTRQVAREVIAGERNAWAAASYLEIGIHGWSAETPEVQTIFQLHDEINWDTVHRRLLPTLTAELIETFARIASASD
jgi:hypothetical protein